MKANFPEIFTFFRRKSFSDLELQSLREQITKQYTDQSILKMANALIDLELLKYRLEKEEVDCNNIKNQIPKSKIAPKPVKKQRVNPFEERNEQCRKEVEYLITKDLFTISEKLAVSISFLRRLCNTEDDYVLDNNPEYEKLRSFIENKIQILNRKKIKDELSSKVVVKKKIKYYSGKDNVFELMKDFGLGGKIIYIRKS